MQTGHGPLTSQHTNPNLSTHAHPYHSPRKQYKIRRYSITHFHSCIPLNVLLHQQTVITTHPGCIQIAMKTSPLSYLQHFIALPHFSHYHLLCSHSGLTNPHHIILPSKTTITRSTNKKITFHLLPRHTINSMRYNKHPSFPTIIRIPPSK